MFGFAGVDDHYFLAAARHAGQPLHVEYRAAVEVPLPGTPEPARTSSTGRRGIRGAAQRRRFSSARRTSTCSPRSIAISSASIDFGMFAWLVVPLLRALKWVNGYVGNYGWSIIILTVLINLAMFPLRHKSVVSMRKMQEIQPEVKAIQDRYAKLKMTDPARQKMNTEMMSLYRERGVNPASGCVPMLLTLPVLFAFYSMLSVAIELRGAPFFGWIHDLSVHDPLFITPGADGHDAVRAAEDDAVDRRSDAAEDDDVHADRDDGDVHAGRRAAWCCTGRRATSGRSASRRSRTG